MEEDVHAGLNFKFQVELMVFLESPGQDREPQAVVPVERALLDALVTEQGEAQPHLFLVSAHRCGGSTPQ